MKALFDLNVIVDVLLERDAHVRAASLALEHAARGHCDGLICGASLDTLFYLLRRSGLDGARSRELVLAVLDVAPVDGDVIGRALAKEWDDLEDAIVDEPARAAGAIAVIKRDRKGFARSTLTILDPGEFLAFMETTVRNP